MKNNIDKKVKSSGNEDLTKVDLLKEKIRLSIEKSVRSESKRVNTVSSGINILIPCSMFFVHSTAKASVLLGSSITSLALGSISMALNIYSLVNNFRDRKLFKTAELEEKRKQELIKENRNKLKVICCDILCDIMFLSAAIASILLLGYSTTIPLLIGGCALMLASICTSYYYKWEQFKSLSSEETEQIKDKHKEKIQGSLVYRIFSKVKVIETILLVTLHQQEKSQQMKEELKGIKQLLRDKKSEVEREQNNKTICGGEEKEGNKGKEDKIAQNSSDIKIKEPFPQEEKPQQMKEELKTTKHLLRDKKSEVDRGQNNKMICNREEERNNKEKENKIGQTLSNVKIQHVPFQKSIICQ